MESIRIVVDNAEEFDSTVQDGAPEACNLAMISKDRATNEGKPAVVISFTAMVEGKLVPVQAVTTLKLLQQAARAFSAAHGGL